MTEKTITARSSFTMQYDPESPNHLAAVHDDGYMNADGKLSRQPHKDGSIYFSEHDGTSIIPAVEMFAYLPGPLYIQGAKLHTHNEYTGTGDTSKNVWIESSDTDALKAFDGTVCRFMVEQKFELIDGEWEPKSATYYMCSKGDFSVERVT